MSPNVLTKSPPRSLWLSPQVASFGVLLLVFLCGAVAGAVAMNMGVHTVFHRSAFWKNDAKAEYLKTIQKQLDLTPEQTEQMDSILSDFAKYYQTVLSDGKSRILNILNDDQKKKFQKMLKEQQR